MSLFDIPTQEVIQILRIRFATPDDDFESLSTLLWTGGHIVHQILSMQHPVTNLLKSVILPNEKSSARSVGGFPALRMQSEPGRAGILGEVMTWHSQRGDRTLTGAEAVLIRETLAYVVDMVEEDITESADPWEFGVAAFDRLEPSARLAMLAEVGWALLRDTESYPELTALNEATVAVLFNAIEQGLEFEIDCHNENELEARFSWRRVLLDAITEGNDLSDLPSVDCRDMSEWQFIIETLSDWILWDHDFASGEYFLDTPPEQADMMRERFGIDDDYYRAIPPDPKECDLPAIRATLKELCGG